MPEPIGQLLTYQTVAQDLACGQTTVKLLARKGLLKRVRLVIPGRRRAMARITKASVEKYKADCLAPAPEPVHRTQSATQPRKASAPSGVTIRHFR